MLSWTWHCKLYSVTLSWHEVISSLHCFKPNDKRVRLGTIVRLLPCDLEVMSLILGNCLFVCEGKTAYIYSSQTPSCGSLMYWAALFIFTFFSFTYSCLFDNGPYNLDSNLNYLCTFLLY